MSHPHSRSGWWVAVLVVAVACVTLPGCSVRGEGPGEPDREVSDVASSAVAGGESHTADASEGMDYDPWERFNEKTFWFNHDVLDRYALKPVANVWAKIPDPMRQGLANAFHNLAMPDRLVNEILQARFREAGSEVARFLLNTTVGVAGFVDVASRVGVEESDADAGQTLGVYGAGPGPYLVVPLLPPLTVRDGIGYAVDSLLDPLSWFVTPFFADFGRAAAKTINERAANLKLYQDVEDASLDLYAAVRNGYLQRRQKSIEDAIRQRNHELDSEILFAQVGDFSQGPLIQGINDEDRARSVESQGPSRP